MKTLITLALLFQFTAAFAVQNPKEVMDDYLQIQTLLAHDTYAGVTDAAAKMSKSANSRMEAGLSQAAKKLATAKDLAEARSEFEKVSTQALKLAYFKSKKNAEVETVYCPMKKVSWVQKKGPIENPYYGKEMLECGVKK